MILDLQQKEIENKTMKASINGAGFLKISAENETESYALKMWWSNWQNKNEYATLDIDTYIPELPK